MDRILIELQYLPPTSYFVLLSKASHVFVEGHEHFMKQTYRNRCYINSTNGTDRLIIPTTHHGGKTLIKNIEIDHHQKWLNRHWRALQSAYGRAPFFEFYAQDLHAILAKKHRFLFDLNLELLTLCLNWLQWEGTIEESKRYENEAPEGIIDWRNRIKPKKQQETDIFIHSRPYHQVFGNEFVANLSIIDLLFCCGPEANQVIFGSKIDE